MLIEGDDVDSGSPADYLQCMKLALQLLMVVLLAAFAVGAVSGSSASAAAVGPAHASVVDQADMEMAACEACASEQMKAGMSGCGSICMSAALAAAGAPALQSSPVVCERFPAGDWKLTGQARLPELTPPKPFLS